MSFKSNGCSELDPQRKGKPGDAPANARPTKDFDGGADGGPAPRVGALWADGIRKDLWERILGRLREPPYDLRAHEAARRARTLLNGLLEIGLVQLDDPEWTCAVCDRGRRLRVELSDPDVAAVRRELGLSALRPRSPTADPP